MTSRRLGAAVIVLANTFMIFGGIDVKGQDDYEFFSSTEIITEEGQVTPGKELF